MIDEWMMSDKYVYVGGYTVNVFYLIIKFKLFYSLKNNILFISKIK